MRVDVIGDLQIPFQDRRTISAIWQFWYDSPPDVIIYNGDWWDFPQLTTKFLRTPEVHGTLLDDLALGQSYLSTTLSIVPSHTRRIFIYGNHEERWRTYIEQEAAELAPLLGSKLDLSAYIREADPGIEVIEPYGAGVELASVWIYHGERVGRGAPAAEFYSALTSGISNHTHRGGVFYTTDRFGISHAWYSNFCLCNLTGEGRPPGYSHGSRDWQQGFTSLFVDGAAWTAYQTIINEHKFIGLNGKLYRG